MLEFVDFDASHVSLFTVTAADCKAGARKGPHKGSGNGNAPPQRAWKVTRVPGPSPLLGALKCHVPPAISVGGVRRVRGPVAGAKRGRAEALQGRCAAGRVAHTELTQ